MAEADMEQPIIKDNEWNQLNYCCHPSIPKNHLEQLNILMLQTGSLGIWECTEGSMADHHRLASHPWIYLHSALIWVDSLELKRKGDWRIDSDYNYYYFNEEYQLYYHSIFKIYIF